MKYKELLIIDDDSRDLIIYETLLTGAQEGDEPFLWGVNVTCNQSPFEDIDDYGKFDAIILDLNLRETTGPDIARQIASKFPNKPLMLMTGNLSMVSFDDKSFFVAFTDKNDTASIWEAAKTLMRHTKESN